MPDRRRHSNVARRSLVIVGMTLAITACGGSGSTPSPASAGPTPAASTLGTPPTNSGPTGIVVTDPANIADLLGPGDFMAVGIAGAAKPTINSTEPGSAYIVFAGKSGATGGIEFDVFVGDNETDAAGIFDDASADLTEPDDAAKTALFGYDELKLTTGLPVDGGGSWAGIAFRKGKLVFTVSIPDSAQAHDQLIALARLVVARGSALA